MVGQYAYNMGIAKSWAEGSFVASFVNLWSNGSGLTSIDPHNFNHQLLFIISAAVGQA